MFYGFGWRPSIFVGVVIRNAVFIVLNNYLLYRWSITKIERSVIEIPGHYYFGCLGSVGGTEL